MSELIKNTRKVVEEFNQAIKDDLSSKMIDATGTASSSIYLQSDNTSVTSKGIFYLHYLDVGRAPGKFPPIDAIINWIEAKGIEIDPYIIARSITQSGTRIFRNRSLGIELDKKRQKVQDNIVENSAKWLKNDLLTELRGFKIK